MRVVKDVKVFKVEFDNGTIFEVGDYYGDGKIESIEIGNDFKEEIEEMEFEDLDENRVPREDVVCQLIVTDGPDDGWGIYIDKEGKEVIEYFG